ncbi:MAG: hypothetical protein M3Q71_01315 [Chloroflexota bacterium]|nr:hypothetical protein [Chloroflexota bacterium]
MTWLTWRLHRTEAAIGILLFAALIVIMLLATQSVDAAYHAAVTGGCLDVGQGILCSERLTNYFERSSRWSNLTTLLHGVPLAVATLLAIPTLQELARGTHRLAWTQSISRRRWSLSRLGFAASIATLVALIWVLTAREWRASILRDEAQQGFGQNAFDLSPAVLMGYALFAVALALTAAVVVRRLVPVLALTAVGFIGTRIFTTFVLRERYRDPIEETIPATDDMGPGLAFQDRWILDETWLTRTGERLSWDRVYQLCPPAANEQNPEPETSYQQCLFDNGLQYFQAFHPTDRFGQFQLIETTLYLGVAAGLFAFAC